MARNTNTDMAVLEIAASLQKIIQDPTLKDSIQKAHGMSADLKQKLVDANAVIANADQVSSDLKKREDAIADVNERIAKAESLETKNAQISKDMDTRQRKLDAQAKQNEANANANSLESIRLQNVSAALDSRAESLKASESSIAALKSDLNKRIEAVKAQAF